MHELLRGRVREFELLLVDGALAKLWAVRLVCECLACAGSLGRVGRAGPAPRQTLLDALTLYGAEAGETAADGSADGASDEEAGGRADEGAACALETVVRLSERVERGLEVWVLSVRGGRGRR